MTSLRMVELLYEAGLPAGVVNVVTCGPAEAEYLVQHPDVKGVTFVGTTVGIPVPAGVFPFTGHKQSFFGDLHALGKDGIRFYTESKCVTTTWFDFEERKRKKVDTWDGLLDHN